VRRCSGARWAYRIVMASEAWPRSSCSSLSVTPRMTAQDANVWRRVSGLEDPTVSLRAEADKGPVRVVVHRHFAAPAALGQLQPDDAAAEVDALPRELQQFAATEAGVQRHGHRGAQLFVPRLCGRVEEPRDLLLGQPAQPTLRLLLEPDALKGSDYEAFALGVRDRWRERVAAGRWPRFTAS